jgi:thiamine-monophosphate kinase
VSITAFGTVPTGRIVRRATAQTGDHVYVSGTIGDAALGLALCADPRLQACWQSNDVDVGYLVRKHSRPQPPVALTGALLACASASMDISDGLVKDFARLCRASNVGGRLDAARVPLSDAARAVIASGGVTLADLLTGGEDYEVLACVAPARSSQFERLADAAGMPVTCIGVIEPASAGVVAVDVAGAPMRFAKTGWDHFSPRSAP